MNILARIAYRIWGPQIARAIASNAVRPDKFQGLSYAFTDHDGKLYYSWPKAENMSAARILRVEACMVSIDHGSSSLTAQKFSETMVEKCNDIAQATNMKIARDRATELVVLCKELTFRRKRLIPEETYFDLAAVCCIREDEDPDRIDPVIHLQKIEAFRNGMKAGDPFFTASPAFQAALGPSLTTVEGCRDLYNNWIRQRIREEAMFDLLSPRQE